MRGQQLSKITLALAVALLLPLLAYTAFQYAQSSRSEALLRSIYQRELESLLFSVNQHCWDVYNSWAAELRSQVLPALRDGRLGEIPGSLKAYLRGKPTLRAALVAEPDGRLLALVERTTSGRIGIRSTLRSVLQGHRSAVERALRQAEKGYYRPVVFAAPGEADAASWAIFPIRVDSLRLQLGGILIDERHFVNDVVARKLNAINNGQFLFAVRNLRTGRTLYETEEIEEAESFERAERVWVLPDVHIQVRLRGTTLEQIARARTRRNLLYLGIVNVMIIAGTVFLLRTVAQEKRLAQMKTDFVANVSHELRTPLSLIRMYAEMLEMGRVPDESKRARYYRTIMNETARLTQLINNVLDFARLEAKRKPQRPQRFSLNEVVSETLEMFRYPFQQGGFEVKVDLAEELPPLRGDRQAVTQALVNLLDNAIKFSRDRRSIHVRTGREDGRAYVSVTDHGVGIPDSQQKKIFEKFYRIGSSLVHETKGSGLGLAIVKRIMEDHGGEVRVRSKPGQGSTFILLFPTETEVQEDGQDSGR